jgi:hypothetical protein
MKLKISLYLPLIFILLFVESTFASELTSTEINGIELMREEEKLAHDVYLFLYEKWELPIFSNILSAETRHYNAIGTLIDNFDLKDPAKLEIGSFQFVELQHLYDSLTIQGSKSLIAALQVSTFIEEVDIQDLQELIEETSNEIIQNVYQNLLRASGNHIRAFTGQLASRNIIYNPMVLNEEKYQTILDTPHQKGGGHGKMHGHGGGTF